jgi:hypothetical protein
VVPPTVEEAPTPTVVPAEEGAVPTVETQEEQKEEGAEPKKAP